MAAERILYGNRHLASSDRFFWDPEQEVVPPVGLEPTLLSEPDFESGASTNSTTGALCVGLFNQRAGGALHLPNENDGRLLRSIVV